MLFGVVLLSSFWQKDVSGKAFRKDLIFFKVFFFFVLFISAWSICIFD